MAAGAQVFGAATSDRVACGTSTSLASLDPYTQMLWVYPTSLSSLRVAFQRGTDARRKLIRLNGTSGNLEVYVDRATTDANYITNDTPLAQLHKWYFIAATFNSAAAAGEVINIYVGDECRPIRESTYGTTNDGSGTVSNNNSDNTNIGNSGAASPTVSWPGRIAWASFIATDLTPAQIEMQRKRTRVLTQTRLFVHLRGETGIQPDRSGYGNHGSCTGTSSHRGPRILERKKRRGGVNMPAATAAAQPYLMLLGVGA